MSDLFGIAPKVDTSVCNENEAYAEMLLALQLVLSDH